MARRSQPVSCLNHATRTDGETDRYAVGLPANERVTGPPRAGYAGGTVFALGGTAVGLLSFPIAADRLSGDPIEMDASGRLEVVVSGLSVSGMGGLESGPKVRQLSVMHNWSPRYTQAELDAAQERYGLRFPPDLMSLFLELHPNLGYDWRVEDDGIRRMLAWPSEALMFDVEHGAWWLDWGERPSSADERREVVSQALAQAPALIPLYSHRFIPEAPCLAGNPIFSMHGFDTIYYGSNIQNYFAREFGGQREIALGDLGRRIPFWSDLAEDHEKWI